MRMLFRLLPIFIVAVCSGCTSVEDNSAAKSSIPWGRPAKWENERIFTPNDFPKSESSKGHRRMSFGGGGYRNSVSPEPTPEPSPEPSPAPAPGPIP